MLNEVFEGAARATLLLCYAMLCCYGCCCCCSATNAKDAQERLHLLPPPQEAKYREIQLMQSEKYNLEMGEIQQMDHKYNQKPQLQKMHARVQLKRGRKVQVT